jgi:hypothetical protein
MDSGCGSFWTAVTDRDGPTSSPARAPSPIACALGGGGCLWALGEAEAIQRLAPVWRDILARRPGARLLSAPPTAEGLRVEAPR